MDKLIELAERCEAAEEADEALDIAILTTALGFRDIHGDGSLFDRDNDGYWVRPEYADAERPALPSPTASLDAAMRLVPEGMVWSLYSDGTAGVGREDGIDMPIADVDAATPALALAAAALRARASMENPNG